MAFSAEHVAVRSPTSECEVTPSALFRWGQKVIGYHFGDSVEWLKAETDGHITTGQLGIVISTRGSDIGADDGLVHVRFANGRRSFPPVELRRVSVESNGDLDSFVLNGKGVLI